MKNKSRKESSRSRKESIVVVVVVAGGAELELKVGREYKGVGREV